MNVRMRVAGYLMASMLFVVSGNAEPAEDWWTRSSLTLPEPDSPWQFHIEISGGGEYLNGNESGETLRGQWLAVLRRGRISLYHDGYVDFQDKDYGQLGSIRQIAYMANSMLRYDLYKELYTAVGYITERDDATFIESRDSWFGGIGQRWSLPGNVSLHLFGALGREHANYDEDVAEAFSVTETESRDSALILSQKLRYEMSSTLAWVQDSLFVTYFDGDQRDRWQFGIGPEISVLPKLSLHILYEQRIEDNPVLEAISGKERNESLLTILRLRL